MLSNIWSTSRAPAHVINGPTFSHDTDGRRADRTASSVSLESRRAKLDEGGANNEQQKDADDCDYYGSACRRGRLGRGRAGQVRPESAEWARVLRVQRIRGLAGCLRQSGR